MCFLFPKTNDFPTDKANFKLAVDAFRLRDFRLDGWKEQIEGRWHFNQLAADPQWRQGWISFDAVTWNPDDGKVYCGLNSIDGDLLYRFDPQSEKFDCLQAKSWTDEFDAKIHRTLLRNPLDGSLWFATSLLHDADKQREAPGGKIVRYDPISGDHRVVAVPMAHLYIQSIAADWQRNLLYGFTYPAELFFRMDMVTSKSEILGYVGNAILFAQPHNAVVDSRGWMWGTYAETRAWDEALGRVPVRLFKYHPIDPVSGETPARIHELTVDADHTLWLGENDNHSRSSWLWKVQWLACCLLSLVSAAFSAENQSELSTAPYAEQAEVYTLPEDQRPEWLSNEGLVMAGSWEPLPFRVRRDGSPGYIPTADQISGWNGEHSQEMIERLKALGVNFVMMHCYKGGGLKLEKDSMTCAVQFAKRCLENGLHVGAYVYSGALLWETLFEELPQANDWIVLNEDGTPRSYGKALYRYWWNRNHPDAIEFYKNIVRFAVNDMRVDLIHLDNFSQGPSYEACSTNRFREHLKRRFTPAQLSEMGVGSVEHAFPPKQGHGNVFLQRAWEDFSYGSLADYEVAIVSMQ